MHGGWKVVWSLATAWTLGCQQTPPKDGWSCGPQNGCPSGYVCGSQGFCVAPDASLPDVPDLVNRPDEVSSPDAETQTPEIDLGDHEIDLQVHETIDLGPAEIETLDGADVQDQVEVIPDVPSDEDGRADEWVEVAPDTAPDADQGDGADIPLCPDPCPQLDATRCVGNRIMTCELQDGCLQWSQPQACGDSDPCTGRDTCQDDHCVESQPPDCDDQNDCTVDFCVPGQGCHNETGEDGLPCDDQNACTLADACLAGACLPGALRECVDDDACTTDACDPLLGCVYPPAADGTSCWTGDDCMEGETCQSGACQGGVESCICHNDSDCAALEDTNPCNGTYRCNDQMVPYICEIDPTTLILCDTSNDGPCQQTTCQPLTGTCVLTVRPDGSACDDGQSCTAGDSCAGGLCIGISLGIENDVTCDGVDDNCDGTIDEGCASGPYVLRWSLVTAAGPANDTQQRLYWKVGRPAFQGSSFDGSYWVRPLPTGR